MKKILYIFLLTFSVSLFAQSPCVHLSIDTISEPYCPSDFGGQLEVSVLGGSGMYSYLWLDSLGNNPSGIPSSSASVSNLNLHEYWVYVTDLIQNCTDSASASFLTYSCVEDTASLSIVSQFSTNPVDYDTYSSCQLMITNNGCEIDLKPEFIISHDSPIAEGAITVEYYNSITSSWENINYSIVNGNAVGYWGDLDGENVGCGSNQSRPVRVLFSQFNPTASLGLYTASLRLWKVNGNGDLLDIISEETLITIELQDTICNNFEFNLITQDASCGNQSDGQITLNSSGGLAPVQYGLNNLNYDSQNTFTALQADNYIVYGQDANGCQISDTLILGPPILDPDTIWFTNINPADALVNWDFNNLVDGYRFRYRVIGESTWIGPVSSPGAYNDGVSNPTTYKMIGGLMGGSSYELQVKTNSLIDNCEEGWSDSHFFETPTESFVFDVGNTCYQLQTGFITLEFNGEMPGYNFSWTDGISFSSTDTSIFDLVSGNYQLMVTNPLDIVILDTSFVISENIPESIDFFLNGDSSLVNQIGNQSFISVCNAESFVETQSGLTNHVWSNGYNGSSMLLDTIPNNTILNLTATNQDGCTVSSGDLYLTIITDFINFQQANTNGDVINHANYFCSSDSSLFLDISDYTSGNFSINWSRIDNNNLISLGTEDSIVLTPTQSSSYLLEIYNCAYQFNVNYLQSIPTTLDISNVLCFGDSGASVIVNAQSTSNEVLIEVFNSDSEVIYSELSSDLSDTIQNLASGFYDVYVSDTTAMCPFENEFEISEPDSLYIHTEDIGSLLCYGDEYGTFMFSVEGGLPPFSFILNGTPIDLTQNPADGSFLLENLTPINYILEVSDSNNCLDTLQFVIEEPDSLIFGVTDFTQNLDCYGDTTAFIQLNVEGGTPSYSFELFDDSQVLLLSQSYSLFSNLTANEYLVTVTDTNGCVDSLFVTISQNDELIVEENEIQHQDISCFNLNDGQVGLDISGGVFPYSATNLSTTLTSSPYLFDNLIADSLTFIVTDSVGCTAELSTVILGLDSFLLDTIQINPISCGEEFGSIDFLLIGSSTYTFELNGTSVEPVFQNDTLATLDSLVVNQYTFIVFDQFGCSDTIYFEMTNQLSTLDLDTISYSDTIQCFGDTTGFINLVTNGGISPFVYTVFLNNELIITDSTEVSNLSNLVAGEYQIIVQDSIDCSSSINLDIFENEELVISEDLDLHQNVSCYGQSDGTFELIVEGGVSPYAVQINQGAIDVLSNPYSNLNASDYNVLITDGLGCADSLLVVITEPDSLFLSMTSVDDITCIDSVSSFNFDINGGSEPYIYTIGEDTVIPVLDPLSGLMQITGLAGGSYNLIVEDNNGCEDSTSFQIIDYRINYNFSVVNYLDTILCFGDSTAFIEVNASGGLEPYVYSVVFEGDTLYTQTQPLFDSLVAGEYQLVSIDSNQCIETIELTIYQNEELIVSDSLEIHRDVLCVGGTGSFTLTADGGVPNYQLNILGEASFNYPHTYENLDAGLYEVIITDALGCTNDIEITIDNPDTLFFESFVVQDVLCFGDSNGELNFSASGGVAPYYYFLDSDSSKSLNEFSIGFYTIEVFDVNGCIIDSTFEVSEPQLLTLGINVSQTQNISCFNGDDGEISLTANGGVFPYQYQIDGGTLQNQNSFSNLDPGTFEMTIVDGNGCDTSILYTLTQPSEDFVISSYSLSDTLGYCVLCYGDSSGTIDIEVSGGAYPFNYFANGTQDSTPTDSIFNNLVGSQDYEFYVVDSLGCFSDTLMINCNSTSEIELSATNQVTPLCCYSCDGQATINASGGTQPFVFSHNGSAFQSSNLFDQTCGGFNQFEVIDANGCQFQQTLSLANIECLELDTFNYMNINNPAVSNYDSCKTENTAHIFVKAIAGVSPFKISFDSQEFIDGGQMFYDGLSSGEYDIVLMDNNLCLDTISVNISEATPLILDSLTIDNLFCGYPSVNSITNVSETGGFTSSVSGGTPSLNGYEFSLDQIDSSSYSYNNSFDNLGNGIYSVNVLDELGCSLEFDVEVNGFSSSAQYVINDISCPGLDDGTIELISVSGTVSPWIEFDENLFSGSYLGGITAGEHILSTQFQYPNDNSLICINYDTIFFYEAQAIEYDLDIESINCNGDCSGSIFINSAVGGTPPYTYSCLTNGETGMFYEDLCVGDYVVRVTDSLGCYESTIVSVGENNPIYPLISQNNGNLVVLEPTNDNPSSGTPPYSYQWYNESGVLAGETSETLSLSVKGRYYVIVTDSFGCEGISAEFNVETVDINSFGLLEFNIFPNPFTDYLNLEYSGDDNVLWTISDNLGRLILKGEFNKSDEINVQSLNNGIYFLTLTKDNNESIFKIIKE